MPGLSGWNVVVGLPCALPALPGRIGHRDGAINFIRSLSRAAVSRFASPNHFEAAEVVRQVTTALRAPVGTS